DARGAPSHSSSRVANRVEAKALYDFIAERLDEEPDVPYATRPRFAPSLGAGALGLSRSISYGFVQRSNPARTRAVILQREDTAVADDEEFTTIGTSELRTIERSRPGPPNLARSIHTLRSDRHRTCGDDVDRVRAVPVRRFPIVGRESNVK